MSKCECKEQELKEEVFTTVLDRFQKQDIACVAFDWDFTVLKVHTRRFLKLHPSKPLKDIERLRWKEIPEDLSPWFADGKYGLESFANPVLFKNVVEACVKLGIRVYILSFGYRAAIKYGIHLLFGRDQLLFNDDNVITPSDFGYVDFYAMNSKLPMLELVQKRLSGSKNSIKNCQMLLYDDTMEIVSGVVANGYKGLVVPRSPRAVEGSFNNGLLTVKSYLF